jgi:hypothetical protein
MRTQSSTSWSPAKLIAAVLAVVATILVAACGPGTGGTGVGPIRGAYVSASISTAVGVPAVGAAPSVVLTPSPGANFVVVFEAERVTLNSACLTFSADGARVESDGLLQIDGLFRITAPGVDPSTIAPLPATLIARVDGSALQVTLRTPSGATLASFGTSARLPDGSAPAPTGGCVAAPG